MSAERDELILLLGEIKGEISGIKVLVETSTAATNKRIDDLKDHLDNSLESTERRVTVLEAGQSRLYSKSAVSGGLSGALIVAGVEIVKGMLK